MIGASTSVLIIVDAFSMKLFMTFGCNIRLYSAQIMLHNIFEYLNHKEMELPQSKLLLLFFLINVSFGLFYAPKLQQTGSKLLAQKALNCH